MPIQIISLQPTEAELIIESLEDCQHFATALARVVNAPLTIGLSGTLGAGKTQWTRYFAMALGAPSEAVRSPTFVLVHQYPSSPPIFHLDAYRLGDEDEMLELGIEEMMESDAITIIEWCDRFPKLMPHDSFLIHFDVEEDPCKRSIRIRAHGQRPVQMLSKWTSTFTSPP